MITTQTAGAASSTARETYSVVVESGSCSQDYKYWEERVNCGHAHKTIEAAKACMAKLTRWYCNHGHVKGTPCSACLGRAQGHSTSATWYNATIHNQDQERAVTA
jgi:hypothetical protein